MSETRSSPASGAPAPRSPIDPVLAAAIALIALATLVPLHEGGSTTRIFWSLELGDALRNVGLYVPLGVAWALRRRSLVGGVLLALALSVGVELLQMVLPGRYSNPWDVTANVAGAVLGAALWHWRAFWLRPTPAQSTALVLATGGLVGASGLAVGWLRLPFVEELRIDAHWTPEFHWLNRYHGKVTGADMNGIRLPHGRLAQGGPIRRALAGRFDVRVIGRVGPVPEGPGILFLITDGRRRDLLSVIVEGDDVWFSYGDRAREVGLVPPRLEISDALRDAAPGSALYVHLERREDDFCLRVNQRHACGLGYSAGDGWTLFVPFSVPSRTGSFFWLAAVALPMGFWARGPRQLASGLGLAALGLFVAPAFFPLLPTGLVQVLGIGCGSLAGVALRRATVGPL